jgi:single-strand DNA-binding protein
MTDTIALTGIVATTPRPIATGDDLKITTFRLASAQRRFDKGRDRWVDGETNWYTVTAFRQLASNVLGSVVKGDRVVVTGRLRIRDWANGDKSGTKVDVEADSVGHDLAWGTTTFTRVMSSSNAGADGAETPPADSFPSSSDVPTVGDDSHAHYAGDEAHEPVFDTADARTPF